MILEASAIAGASSAAHHPLYWLTDTAAFGTPLARTALAERQTGTHYMTASIDALGRRTEYTYDAKGNVLTVTRLAGTGNAVTTTFTYQDQFSLLTSVTDPLGHTTSFGRDGKGNLTSITDALAHQRTFTYSPTGLLLTASDTAGTTQFGYDAGDLVSIADPLGRTTTRFVDVAGRLLAQTDPLGRQTQYTHTPLGLVATMQDARGGITAFTYDGNGNLLTLTDALNLDLIRFRGHLLKGGQSRPMVDASKRPNASPPTTHRRLQTTSCPLGPR